MILSFYFSIFGINKKSCDESFPSQDFADKTLYSNLGRMSNT